MSRKISTKPASSFARQVLRASYRIQKITAKMAKERGISSLRNGDKTFERLAYDCKHCRRAMFARVTSEK